MDAYTHLVLYAGLGILLRVVSRPKLSISTVVKMSLIILCVGVLQEGLQFLSKGLALPHTILLSRGIINLIVDQIGGLLGLIVMRNLRTSYR